MGVGILQLNSKSTMNAALCNIYPIFKFSETHSQPSRCPSSWIAGRSSNRLPTPRSLVIETVEGQVDEETRSESVARRLILLRHAKSSWTDRSLRDHDRPLSKAGRADAINISHKLQQLGWIPELILCSDAMRTRETLKIMQEQVRGFSEAEVHFISSFYSIAAMDGQTAEHLQQAICKFSRDEILTVIPGGGSIPFMDPFQKLDWCPEMLWKADRVIFNTPYLQEQNRRTYEGMEHLVFGASLE